MGSGPAPVSLKMLRYSKGAAPLPPALPLPPATPAEAAPLPPLVFTATGVFRWEPPRCPKGGAAAGAPLTLRLLVLPALGLLAAATRCAGLADATVLKLLTLELSALPGNFPACWKPA